MSFEDERRAIEARFAANFSTVPIRWENVPFTQIKTAWVALRILRGEGNQASTNSNPLYRYAGVIQVDINVPENVGVAQLNTLADAVEAIFRGVQFSSVNSGTITCRAPYLTTLGLDAGWYRGAVTAPYQRDKRN